MALVNFLFADNNNIWKDNLSEISHKDWNIRYARHLLERAGFGGTPEEVKFIYKLGVKGAVKYLVYYDDIIDDKIFFDESGIFDKGIENFPSSRPATTKLAKEKGEALGVKVKPSGNRPLQPVVNKFFYWLRASKLESERLGYWWANKMLSSKRPLEEKMTLFWHNHFATSESKVRDYRKMLLQNNTLRKNATSDFRTILIEVAKDPAMLNYLDAGKNIKGSPNENFAREIMELFTMGEGHYSEEDIREAAKAFTGWDSKNLKFLVIDSLHDNSEKNFLGNKGNFDGEDIIDIILEKDVTANFIVKKIYINFVDDTPSKKTIKELAFSFKNSNFDIKFLLSKIFSSKDFFSERTIGSHIKSPIELVINTYKKVGLKEVPGIPDFNLITDAMGQKLFWPPTVAGWPSGRSWITPGLLIERNNFVYDTFFPNVGFTSYDRYAPDPKVRIMHDSIVSGLDITSATRATQGGKENKIMAESNMMADRNEDFNTRLGVYKGWQKAIEKVIPLKRKTANINFSKIVEDHKLNTIEKIVDYFILRFLTVPIDKSRRDLFINFFKNEIGTEDVLKAQTYIEEPLRKLLHIILSQPDYQLS